MTLAALVSPPGDDPIIVERDFQASPASLFEAWTKPEELKKWFRFGEEPLKEVTIDLRIGGQWQFSHYSKEGYKETLGGLYEVITPNEKLVFTWRHQRILNNGETETTGESRVTISLNKNDNGVSMRLMHAGILSEDVRNGIGQGWVKLSDVMGEQIERVAS